MINEDMMTILAYSLNEQEIAEVYAGYMKAFCYTDDIDYLNKAEWLMKEYSKVLEEEKEYIQSFE